MVGIGRDIYSFRQFRHKVRDKIGTLCWANFTRRGRRIKRMVKARCKTVGGSRAVEFPEFLHIELTNRCNLNCRMCPHGKLKRKIEDMDFGLFTKIVDQLPLNGVDSVGLYHFGESLLYPRLAEAIRYVADRDRSIYTRLRTNGQLLTEEKAIGLLTCGLKSVEFSINGWGEQDYKAIMRNGDYERLLDNVKGYLRLKKRLNAQQESYIVTVLQESTRKYMRQFTDEWSQLLPVAVTDLHSSFNAGAIEPDSDGMTERIDACPEVFYHAIVLSNGEVTFCCRDVEGRLSIGNVKERPLHEIWHGEKAQRIRDLHTNKKFEGLPVCRYCNSGILRCGVPKR